MDQEEIVPYLPPEVIVNILSRIPIKTVLSCKCVCKSWLDLLKTPEFIRDHLSNSLPRLLFRHASKIDVFRVIEIDESFKIDCKKIKYKALLELDIVKILNLSDHSGTTLEGSANGLIFLRNASDQSSNHFICNPVTRERLKLPEPEGIHQLPSIVCYGFGRSRSSNQYKVVRILHDCELDPDVGYLVSIPKSVCQVYTLGTGSWRTIATPPEMFLDFGFSSPGKTLNGKIYWSARDVEHSCWIACFDLETEAFTRFQPPAVESEGDVMDVGILQNRLCLCDNTSKSKLCVYLMSGGDGDGEERSWNKAHVVNKIPAIPDDVFRDVKVLGGGDVLMASANFCLVCLSPRTKTVEPVVVFSGDAVDVVEAVSYMPSLISLKDFETEDAKVSEFACSMS